MKLAALLVLTLSAIANAGVVIMPIGDSITGGGHGVLPGSYRADLQAKLAMMGIAYDFVGEYAYGAPDPDFQGVGGARIENMTASYGSAVAQYQPDYALVLAGTNNRFDVADFYGFVDLYTDLVSMIRSNSPDTRIVFSTVPKIGYDRVPATSYWTPAHVDSMNLVQIPNMNDALNWVSSIHSDTAVVDLYSALDPSADLTADGVHPNLYGHWKLAELFAGQIQADVQSIPEPSGFILMLCAGLAFFFIRRKR